MSALFAYLAAVIGHNTTPSRRCSLLRFARNALQMGNKRGLTSRALSALYEGLVNLIQIAAKADAAVEAVRNEVASWREEPYSSNDEEITDILESAKSRAERAKAPAPTHMSFALGKGTKRKAQEPLPRPTRRHNPLGDPEEDNKRRALAPAARGPRVVFGEPPRRLGGVRGPMVPGFAVRVRRRAEGGESGKLQHSSCQRITTLLKSIC